MIDTRVLKQVLKSIGAGLVILFAIIWMSEWTLGDLTNTDSFAPLLIIIPVLAGVVTYLVKAGK